jgi:hypothetical protein
MAAVTVDSVIEIEQSVEQAVEQGVEQATATRR